MDSLLKAGRKQDCPRHIPNLSNVPGLYQYGSYGYNPESTSAEKGSSLANVPKKTTAIYIAHQNQAGPIVRAYEACFAWSDARY